HQVILEKYAKPEQIIFAADSHTNTAGAVGAFAHGMGATDIAATLKLGKTWIVAPTPIATYIRGTFPKGTSGKDVALYILAQFGAEGLNGYSVEATVENPKAFPIDDRATVANMSTEMGADAFMFIPDQVTTAYLESRGATYSPPQLKLGGHYDRFEIELDRLEPLVAAPHSVDNVKSVREVEGVEVDQVFIGSCTNGRLGDFETAAKILKGEKARSRCIAIPASYDVFRKALELGYVDILTKAGCVVTYSTCGPCLGGHFGIAGPGEVVLTTTNRNFRGRVGHPDAEIYLANPATAAATALKGKITDPRTVM
ncbi:MAG: aconitase/3-isopropylmalate dehydratase large subunit family protein, partial [Pyrobaculum sp.]